MYTTGINEFSIKIYEFIDKKSPPSLKSVTTQIHDDDITCMCIDPLEDLLFCGAGDGTI